MSNTSQQRKAAHQAHAPRDVASLTEPDYATRAGFMTVAMSGNEITSSRSPSNPIVSHSHQAIPIINNIAMQFFAKIRVFSHMDICYRPTVFRYIGWSRKRKCNLIFILVNSLNITVKSVSFFLEWLHWQDEPLVASFWATLCTDKETRWTASLQTGKIRIYIQAYQHS